MGSLLLLVRTMFSLHHILFEYGFNVPRLSLSINKKALFEEGIFPLEACINVSFFFMDA